MHQRGDEHRSQDERVHQHRATETNAELGDDPLAAEREREEDADHDQRRRRDDATRVGLAVDDCVLVVARVHPLLVHPRHQEDLVVHGEAKEDGDHDDRQERLDRARAGSSPRR